MPRSKRSNKLPPFVPMTWELLNSNAYKDLKYASAKALPYFLGKYKGNYHDPQKYYFTFSFSYSEAKVYGFSNSTFYKVIQDVIRKGFIDPVDKGGLRGDGRSYNLFKLSNRWEKYGKKDFESLEWKQFVPRFSSRATPKSETYNSKKGNEMPSQEENISEIEVVEVF